MNDLWEIINSPDFKDIKTRQGYHDFLKKRGALSKYSTNDKWVIGDPLKYRDWERKISEAVKLQKTDDALGLTNLDKTTFEEI